MTLNLKVKPVTELALINFTNLPHVVSTIRLGSPISSAVVASLNQASNCIIGSLAAKQVSSKMCALQSVRTQAGLFFASFL